MSAPVDLRQARADAQYANAQTTGKWTRPTVARCIGGWLANDPRTRHLRADRRTSTMYAAAIDPAPSPAVATLLTDLVTACLNAGMQRQQITRALLDARRETNQVRTVLEDRHTIL